MTIKWISPVFCRLQDRQLPVLELHDRASAFPVDHTKGVHLTSEKEKPRAFKRAETMLR